MTFTPANASRRWENDPAEHWAQQYLARKWVLGGRGPDVFDCWGLVWFCKKKHYGQDLPCYPGCEIDTLIGWEKTNTTWAKLTAPVDGCVVAMGRNRLIHHVGLYLDVDGGRVLHAQDQANVVAESLTQLKTSGMRRIEFFQWVPNS